MPCKITRLTRAGDRYRDAFLDAGKNQSFAKNRLQNGLGFAEKILGVGKSQSFTRTDFKIV